MRAALALLVVALAVLGGCARATWRYDKPKVTHAQMDHDMNECKKSSVPQGPLAYPGLTGMDRDAFNRCMRLRGYTVTQD